MKRWIVILVLLMITAFMIGCSDNDQVKEEDNNITTDMDSVDPDVTTLELTLEDLKAFNGQNGQPAYVAVDGIIYDMSDSNFWKNGQHNGFQAGQDLTEVIKNQSPHGVKNLERVPKVGILVE